MAKIADRLEDLAHRPLRSFTLANTEHGEDNDGQIVLYLGWFVWTDGTVHDEPEVPT